MYITMGPKCSRGSQASLKSLANAVLFSLENLYYRVRVTVIRLGGKGE